MERHAQYINRGELAGRGGSLLGHRSVGGEQLHCASSQDLAGGQAELDAFCSRIGLVEVARGLAGMQEFLCKNRGHGLVLPGSRTPTPLGSAPAEGFML